MRILVGILLSWLPVAPPVGQDSPVRPVPSPAEIDDLIDELESPVFSVRQRATRRLIEAGPAALQPLAERTKSARLELSVRALAVFESCYVGKDKPAVLAAGEHLETFAESTRRELAEHARAVLTRHAARRVRLAVPEIRKRGGQIELDPPTGVPWLALDDRWKGGLVGLKFVRRLRDSDFQVYLIDGLKVPEKEKAALEKHFRDGAVNRRGRVMFGITSSRLGRCTATEVVRGKSAWRAGLRDGDTILSLDGKEVRDFDDLVVMLKSRKPDQKFEVVVSRRDRSTQESLTLTLKGTLDRWKPSAAATP